MWIFIILDYYVCVRACVYKQLCLFVMWRDLVKDKNSLNNCRTMFDFFECNEMLNLKKVGDMCICLSEQHQMLHDIITIIL